MAEDGSTQSKSEWPIPKFRFEVSWDSAKIAFQEVSGLDMEAQVIEYRSGDSPNFAVTKQPGIKKFPDVTMKKGMFKGDKNFTEWFKAITMNTIKRKAVTISLLDEEANALVIWKLSNAWPTKITGTDLKSTANEIAIETIVIAHEGMEVEVK
jgi:phage tail-like protein